MTRVTTLLFAAAMTFAPALSAQSGPLGGTTGGTTGGIYIPPTPPVLPPSQNLSGGHAKLIGNATLGGRAATLVGMARTKSSAGEYGHAYLLFDTRANLLGTTRTTAMVVGNAQNSTGAGLQTRSGSWRVEIAGYVVTNSTFGASAGFATATSLYALHPGSGVTATYGVGPISVTLRANATCALQRAANWSLPAGAATVGLQAMATSFAIPNAWITSSAPSVGSQGVSLQASRIFDQTLTVAVQASGLWGLTGDADVVIQPISLHFAIQYSLLYTWTSTLCSFSSPAVALDLL